MIRAIILCLAAPLCYAATPYVNGLGASTYKCIDVDGDGYGTGETCTGRDADDFDSTVHTATQATTKYSSMALFLSKRGYEPTNIYYIATTGTDAGSPPNCKNNPAAPCATFAYIRSSLVADDMVMWRSGTYTEAITITSGSSGNPIVYMAYPGETVVFDQTGIWNPSIVTGGYSYWVVDGFNVTGTTGGQGCIDGGTNDGITTSAYHHWVIRNNYGYTSCGLGLISAFNGLEDATIEYNVMRDNGGEHGIYIGARGLKNQRVTVRRNLFYRNIRNGLYHNGRCENCTFEQNISHSNYISGFVCSMGCKDSTISSNLIFNNGGAAFLIWNYTESPGEGVLAYDQTGNTIENNTVVGLGTNPLDSSGATQPAILIQDAGATGQNLGGNIYRNNIFVNNGGTKPPIQYRDYTPGDQMCSAACMAWLASDTWTNNLSYSLDGSTAGPFGLWDGVTLEYSCAASASLTTLSGCVHSNPLFTAVSTSDWNNITALDFSLQSGSPAWKTGVTTGLPYYDLPGRAYIEDTPSRGAIERSQYTPGWNALTSATLTSALCPATGFGGSTAWSGTLGMDLGFQYDFPASCHQIVQSWGGAAWRDVAGKPKQLLLHGGGHGDYGGNEVYAVNFNLATPTATRLNNPSVIKSDDYALCPTSLPSSGPPYDGPPSTHTYSALAYATHIDKMFHVGGQVYCGNGPAAETSWTFDPNVATIGGTKGWVGKDPTDCGGGTCLNFPTIVEGAIYAIDAAHPISPTTVYDPYRQSAWVFTGYTLLEYSFATNQYILRRYNGSADFPNGVTGVFRSSTREVWIVGDGYFRKYSVGHGATAGASYDPVDVSVDSSCDTLKAAHAPGFDWHPLQDKLYAWGIGFGDNVHVFDPTTNTCTTQSFTGGPTSSSVNGIFNRFRYSESLSAFVLQPEWGTPYVLQLGDADGGGEAPGSGGLRRIGGVRVSGSARTQ